jgi:signal transduction histidine kinase
VGWPPGCVLIMTFDTRAPGSPTRPTLDIAAGDREAIEAAYAGEFARLLRTRFLIGSILFVVVAGLGITVEAVAGGGPATRLATLYPFQILLLAVAIVATRTVPPGRATTVIVTASVMALDGFFLTHDRLAGMTVEWSAMAQTGFMTGVAILLPWGVYPQLLLAMLSTVGFLLVATVLPTTAALGHAALTVAGVSATTVYAARFLERYRHDAFVQNTLLDRAAATRQEEADISAALLHVAEELNAHPDRPDMLERVTSLAAKLLDVDYCAMFVWDERSAAFRLREAVGLSPTVRGELGQLSFTRGAGRIGALQPGRTLEVPDVRALPEPVGPLLRRWEVSSLLAVPICRGERIVGILASGNRARAGAFSPMQHRLLIGIAHAAAIAFENARLIEHLHAASRLKSEFVATMSHELRTPLNVIMGYADLLAEGSFGPLQPAQQDTLTRIQQNAVQLFELVNATLDLGRLESGREPVTLEPVNTAALLAELGREVEALVQAGVELSWRNELGDEPVLTDRGKLKTILKNLVGNALKFTPRGSVRVEVTWRSNRLGLVVADTGIGIAAEQLPAIFEMFRQIDASHTRRFGGVGLGLHIVKRLVDLLGGTVDVASTLGLGSTFTVTLPARPAEERRASA